MTSHSGSGGIRSAIRGKAEYEWPMLQQVKEEGVRKVEEEEQEQELRSRRRKEEDM